MSAMHGCCRAGASARGGQLSGHAFGVLCGAVISNVQVVNVPAAVTTTAAAAAAAVY